jgi:hypothetical protein
MTTPWMAGRLKSCVRRRRRVGRHRLLLSTRTTGAPETPRRRRLWTQLVGNGLQTRRPCAGKLGGMLFSASMHPQQRTDGRCPHARESLMQNLARLIRIPVEAINRMRALTMSTFVRHRRSQRHSTCTYGTTGADRAMLVSKLVARTCVRSRELICFIAVAWFKRREEACGALNQRETL